MLLITAPTVEPITLPEAKLHLRLIAATTDVAAHPLDGEVARLISMAREYAEQFCGRAFAPTTYEARGPNFGTPLLPPVTAIDSVKYLDATGTEQTLAATVYELGTNTEAPTLRLKIGQAWPSVYNRDDAVRVRFAAGPAAAAVPALAKAAMLLLIDDLEAHRRTTTAASNQASAWTMPRGATDLLQPYRRGLGV